MFVSYMTSNMINDHDIYNTKIIIVKLHVYYPRLPNMKYFEFII